MCEDFPFCGHELDCCPSFDDSGRQLDMVCTCGMPLPVDSMYSVCFDCLCKINSYRREDVWDARD